jgi:CO/xanthine dehydrogenase Mo-binding subunit
MPPKDSAEKAAGALEAKKAGFPLGGETPIIAIAPAIANAVLDATGVRVRSLPIRDAAPRKT